MSLENKRREAKLRQTRGKMSANGKAAPEGKAKPSAEKDEKPRPAPAAGLLVEIGMECELWHDSTQTGYASKGRASHPIRSRGFRHLLVAEYKRRHERVPNSESIGNALTCLEAAAVHDGPEHRVFTRVAGHDGKVFLHLADSDSNVIEIDRDGWRLCDRPPVFFRKSSGMLPLPMPERGGNIDELKSFLNVHEAGAFSLVIAWLVAALRPDGPFPLLVLSGEQGSAKSTTARALRRLVDPSAAPLRCEPKEARDLMIQARNSWALAFDNLSYCPAWLSDALCRLATGGGFGTRQLYTDDEEVIFDSMRPVILNGIESFVTRPDLAERSLLLVLPTIPEHRRQPESKLWPSFDEAHPRLLGALLDRGIADAPIGPTLPTSPHGRFCNVGRGL